MEKEREFIKGATNNLHREHKTFTKLHCLGTGEMVFEVMCIVYVSIALAGRSERKDKFCNFFMWLIHNILTDSGSVLRS